MVATGKTVVLCAATLAGLVQFCPAPPVVAAIAGITAAEVGATAGVVGAIGSVAGSVEGGIAASHSGRKRQSFRRQQANQQAWDDCKGQLASASVTFSAPQVGNVLVQGVPSACMTLLTVITGDYDAGNPVPQGSDSVLFSNLSDSDIQELQDALSAHA